MSSCMREMSNGSPYRRNRNPKDLESGSGSGDRGEEYDVCDPFDIVRTKSAPVDRLKRWRVISHSVVGFAVYY